MLLARRLVTFGQKTSHFWPKVTVLLAKSRLFFWPKVPCFMLFFWPKAGSFFGQKPAPSLAKSRLPLARYGPTGLIILLYCGTRPTTALRALLYYNTALRALQKRNTRLTGIHGNTGNTGIQGIHGNTGTHGNQGNTLLAKSRLLSGQKPAPGALQAPGAPNQVVLDSPYLEEPDPATEGAGSGDVRHRILTDPAPHFPIFLKSKQGPRQPNY